MREPIKVERATSKDYAQMAEWMGLLSHRNNIDTDIFSYPSTDVLKASNGHSIIYMPRQKCHMLESLAINPDAQHSDVALSLRAMMQVSEYEARVNGEGELYFLCADAETKGFCIKHGFDIMTPRVILAKDYDPKNMPDVSDNSMQLFRRKLL